MLMKPCNKTGFSKYAMGALLLAVTLSLQSVSLAAPPTAAPKSKDDLKPPKNLEEALARSSAKVSEEQMAYTKFVGITPKTDYTKRYLDRLSPGGRAYFFANKHEFALALQELDKLPDKTSGSVLYTKAFCLAGLGKDAEAAKVFEQAKAKIGKDFNPGFRFYLQLSTNAFETGNLKQYAIDTALTRKKVQEVNEDQRDKSVVLTMLDKRDVASIEKSGDYKLAFDKYVVMFNKRSDQLHLNDPIEADAATKTKAAAWLKKNTQPPEKATPEVEAKFYLTQGKAFLATGDKAAAKKSFEKVLALKAPNELGLPTRGSSDEIGSSFGKVKDQAKVILVRLYNNEKNYQQACIVLRQLFIYDPFTELDYWYNMIPMADVPELVTKKDKDLHDVKVEKFLDHSLPTIVVAKPMDMKNAYDYRKDPLLMKARSQVDAGNFAACYETLGTYLRTNMEPGGISSSVADITKRSMFFRNFAFSMRLYNLAVGIAAGRNVGHLTLRMSTTNKMMDEFWLAVEEVLQGRKNTATVMKEMKMGNVEHLSALERYCHFATAVRAMNLKEYKLAVKEFDSIKQPPAAAGVVQFLPNYTAALKKWCQQQN
ncbi:MAG: hypothetical protein C0507_12165 [Cyanobacteria bacterium PR.3.49]|nr:hypothetical protein [Cyanobacteria bacterium PR.3.49]